MKKSVSVFLCIVVFCGCTKYIKVAEKPAENMGYVYGKFHVDKKSHATFGIAGKIGLELVNLETSEVNNIMLKKQGEDVYAIAVLPGKYKIENILFSVDWGGETHKKVPFEPVDPLQGMGNPFEVKQGKLYYIGDYYGRTYAVGHDSVLYEWEFQQYGYHYEETTKAFHDRFPAFQNYECIPAFQLGKDGMSVEPNLQMNNRGK